MKKFTKTIAMVGMMTAMASYAYAEGASNTGASGNASGNGSSSTGANANTGSNADSGSNSGINSSTNVNRRNEATNRVESRMTRDSDRNDMNDETDSSDRSFSGNTTLESQTSASDAFSRNQIQNAQEALKDKGYMVSIDGVVGGQTSAAIREFQQDNNLSVTGTLNSETMAALDSGASARGTRR